ncbi:MAG: lamin tail domain-containing protein [Gammaproteobacteria bacterium]|nr:lamin tail domain-containing protein [Gammaproteobacteria bacterium]
MQTARTSKTAVRNRLATAIAALLCAGASGSVSATGIYFSEYIEGSSNNKALEIYNGTGAPIDLGADGYVVAGFHNGNTTTAYELDLTGTLAAGDVYVIAHSSANPSILGQADLTTGTGLWNGDDALVLYSGGFGNTVVDSFGQVGFDPGSQWSSNGVTTQNATLRRSTSVTMGDTNPNDTFDPSIEWLAFNQDDSSDLGQYGVVAPPPTTTDLSIMQIQGAAHASDYAGQSDIRTNGIVTQIEPNGFFMQDATGDGDDSTSDGIFVFTGTAPTVAVGDDVSIVGSVEERFGATQLSNVNAIDVMSSGNSIAPLNIGTDPTAGHDRLIPTRLVDDSGRAVFDEVNEGRDFYESLEGMLVRVQQVQAVSNTRTYGSDADGDGIGNSDREVYAVADGGIGATTMNDRGGITIAGDSNADNPIGADLNPERLLINRAFDDDLDHEIVQGDRLSSETDGSIVGTIHYAFDDYILNAGNQVAKDRSGSPLTAETSSLAPDADRLTVGSYNVLNLDTNEQDGDTDIANGQFAKIAGHIVNHANSPDVIGLQEIQDNDGSTDSGETSGGATLQMLIDEIVAAGGPQYAYIDNTFIADGTNGGQPGGNIRTAFLYNPDRVSLVPGSVSSIIDPTDQQTNPANPFFDSRLPLAAQFVFNGEEVLVINNHLASKSGSDALFGNSQPPENGQLALREAMAALLNAYVASLLATDPDSNIVVLGDMNEFDFFSPLDILATGADSTAELTNLVTLLADSSDAYSYVFEGNSQLLDHMLASGNLMTLDPLFDILHVNTGFMYAGLSGSAIDTTQTAASDHDMLLASFRIGSPPSAVPVAPAWLLLLAGYLVMRHQRRRL